jgi:hypothetical protein
MKHQVQSTHRPASSLLLVMAITAAAIIVLLTGSKLVLEVLRSRSSLSSAQVADQMVQAGLDEGIVRIKQNLLNTNSEYGTTPVTTWPQQSARIRGFQEQTVPGTSCQTIRADGSSFTPNNPDILPFDSACPRYGLLIQTAIKTTAQKPQYEFPAIDLPNGVGVIVPVQTGVLLSFAHVAPATSVIVSRCTTRQVNSCVGSQDSSVVGSVTLDFSGAYGFALVQANYAAAALSQAVVRVSRQGNPSDPTFTIGINYYRLTATGIAPDGAQRTRIYQIRHNRTTGETVVWTGFSALGGSNGSGGGSTATGTPDLSSDVTQGQANSLDVPQIFPEFDQTVKPLQAPVGAVRIESAGSDELQPQTLVR